MAGRPVSVTDMLVFRAVARSNSPCMELHSVMRFLLLLLLPFTAAADDAPLPGNTGASVPAWLLEIPASVDQVFVADTANATMRRFVRAGDRIVEKDQRYMSIGQNGVGKVRAWDKRTPLGVYFIVEELDTSRLHDKYGVAAFPLDYPNPHDRFRERTGDGIWLHGVDHRNPDRPPLDTDGCLALPNEALLEIASTLKPLVTPVVVTREMRWASKEQVESVKREFHRAFATWRSSLERGDLVTYLGLYADDFRYRDMDRDAWAGFKLGAFEAQQVSAVTVRDLLLLADPEEPGLYLSRFEQVLSTDAGDVTTIKRLYWRRDDSRRWQIVTEGAG